MPWPSELRLSLHISGILYIIKLYKFTNARQDDNMLTYNLDASAKQPLYEQLSEAIKDDILTGKLKGGDKLPSKRNLAQHLGISKITVENAYSQLLAEGYIYSLERSGYYVENITVAGVKKKEEQKGTIPEEKRVYSKAPAELFPFSVWSRLMRSVILDSGAEILAPAPGQGLRQIREAISSDILKRKGTAVDPGQIFIGSGSEYFYTMLVQFFGRNRKYAIENPGYKKIAYVYEASGADTVPLSVDEGGIIPKDLEGSGADILHITPYNHFPTGAVMPIGRRQQIVSWLLEDENRYIIEDDYDSEFRFTGKPIPSMQSMDRTGRIIYINTFSRTIAPALRISYMILPVNLVEKWRSKMGFYNCTVPSFDQLTLTQFISGGYFERHINRLKKHYASILEQMVKIAGQKEFSDFCRIASAGRGLNFTVEFLTAKGENILREALEECLPQATLIKDYCIGPADESYRRLAVVNFTGLTPEDFEEGLRKLAFRLDCKLGDC